MRILPPSSEAALETEAAAEPSRSTARRERLSERVLCVPPSGIRRFFDLIQTMEDVISLGVGEPDFTTPWHIREAAISSLERGQTMYTSNLGMPELRRALAAHLSSLYGVPYDPATELLITVGVSEGLDLAMRAILNPGDEVLIPDPGYVSYAPCVTFAGGGVKSVPTSAANGFRPNPQEFAKRVGPRTKAILIGYPNNPTGAVPTRQELEGIARVAAEHDLIVVSDEIYDRLVYGRAHTCFSSLPEMRDRTILLGGFSKDYAMTGWRVGYAAAPPDLLAGMLKIHQYTALCASTQGQVAAIEALKNGETDVVAMRDDYDRRRRVIVKGLNDVGLACPLPEGAFYAFPSVAVLGQSDEEFAERLLLEEKVAVVPGSAFGECGKDQVRCCYATSLPQIEEAICRIGRFVERHRP